MVAGGADRIAGKGRGAKLRWPGEPNPVARREIILPCRFPHWRGRMMRTSLALTGVRPGGGGG